MSHHSEFSCYLARAVNSLKSEVSGRTTQRAQCPPNKDYNHLMPNKTYNFFLSFQIDRLG